MSEHKPLNKPGRGRKPGDLHLQSLKGSRENMAVLSVQAFEMRRQGKTMRAIAQELGISVGSVHEYIRRVRDELNEQSKELAERIRAEQLEQCEELLARWLPLAMCKGLSVQKITEDRKGEPVFIRMEEFDAAAVATDRIMKIMKRQAELLGLDKPVKVEVSEPITEDEILSNAEDAEKSFLLTMAASVRN